MMVANKIIITLLLLLTLVQLNMASSTSGQNNSTITVKVKNGEDIRELQLIVFKDEYSGPISIVEEPFDRYVARSQNDYFIFHIDLKGCKYFQVNLNQKDITTGILIERNLLEEGDFVHIKIGEGSISFEGKGARKMNFLNRASKESEALKDSVMKTNFPQDFSNINIRYLYRDFKKWEVVKNIMRERIQAKENGFSRNTERYLIAEIIGKIDYSLYNGANGSLTNGRYSDSEKDTIRKFLWINDWIIDPYVNKDQYMMSKNRIEANFQYYRFHYRLRKSNSPKDSLTMIDYLNKINPKTVGWEKMMTYNILSTYHHMDNVETQVKSVLKYINTPWYAAQLKELIDSRYRSKEFELYDLNENIVRLSSYRGKTVFIDFWFVGCLACTQYFNKTVSKAEVEFGKDVVFISICIEKDKKRWLKAVEGGQYTSPEALNLYTGPNYWKHPVVSEFAVSSAPRPFLLDENGKIISLNLIELGRGNYEKLRQKLREILKK